MSGKPKSVSKTDALPWGVTEIVTHYQAAKNPVEMIKILAELNATTPNRIRRVLYNAGVEPARVEPSKRQMAHTRIMLERDGCRYTVAEATWMHHLCGRTIRDRCKGDTVELDGKVYRVIRHEGGDHHGCDNKN